MVGENFYVKMKLYKMLENKKKRIKKIWKLKEFEIYYNHKELLNKYPHCDKSLIETNDDFKIIQASILIQSLLNKQIIEERVRKIAKVEAVDDLNSIYEGLPYLLNNEENKIYIPSFPLALNFIYADEPMKLNEHPYDELRKDFTASLIDPFDEYGFKLYDSLFSRLVKISECGEVAFFYHIDISNIYVINDQGRLDAKICLFDKYMHHINKNGIIERLKPVIDAYNSNDKKALVDGLLTNDLISARMHHYIYKKERKFERRQFKIR